MPELFEPYDYQGLALDHLRRVDRGCLFMGCGLGKTATCLQRFSELIDSGESRGFLVIAPLRVCNLTWPEEVEQWENFSWMEVANLRTDHGKRQLFKKAAHLYLINYEMLPWLADNYFYNRKRKDYAFDGMIVDELTRAKNYKSSRIKAVRQYTDKFKWAWGLTGTPAPNSLIELFGQMLFIDQGETFGRHIGRFRDSYFHNVSPVKRYAKYESTRKSERIMHRKLREKCITLKTSDYLDLPDIEEEDIVVKLKPKGRKIYDTLKKELVVRLESGTLTAAEMEEMASEYEELTGEGDFSFRFDGSHNITAVTAAVLTMKLLQATSGCIYTSEDRKPVTIGDEKIAALKKLCKNYRNKSPVMVACWFRHEQERFRSIPGAELFSDRKRDDDQRHLQKSWNDGNVPVMVVHPASVGHGINLQKGGHIGVWTTVPWSRELYDQTNARLHRKGQLNPVKIYRILAESSVDDLVVESLRQKNNRQMNLLNALRKLKS